MARSEDTIETLVGRVKEAIRKLNDQDVDPCLFLSPSAYDTAWLAMVPNPREERETRPMFEGCLDWILKNQKPEWFWGEQDCNGHPTIDSLSSTLACMVALKTWGVGHDHIQKGMAFISSASAKLLKNDRKDNCVNYPRWFAIVFPAMVELAQRNGLQLIFPDDVKEAIADVLRQHQCILRTEMQVERTYAHHLPLLAYLEALPPTYKIDNETILENLDEDGSLFRSPSATAAAFLATGNRQPLSYLLRLLPSCSTGVPSIYPIDEDFIRLYVVHEIQQIGLSEHFSNEVKEISDHIYRKYNEQGSPQQSLAPTNFLKDSLAFQLLRLQGRRVSPKRLCWFLNDAKALKYIEENVDKFSSVLYNLYRATNLQFQGETELQRLRSFVRKLLQKAWLSANTINDDMTMWPHLQEVIKHELSIPWMARMDHLENRRWIEESGKRALWLGKVSYYRIPCIDNKDLLRLAKENYERLQLVYNKELQELVRWCKALGLMDMGFAREKTVYSYFAAASSVSFPCEVDSDIRLTIAKAAVLIVIADDFFDLKGTIDELRMLTKAVQRWDKEGLRSHSEVIFDALDYITKEVAKKYFDHHGIDIMDNLRQIWYETFSSWMVESTWSKLGKVPSMASYLKNGMISIAAHTLVLHASCTLTPTISPLDLNPPQYEEITKFIMISCRLLNDIQDYERELKNGKVNSVMLYLRENPDANIGDAIDYLQSTLEDAKMKVLEHTLMQDMGNLPSSFKMLHFGCLKVFQMFFNSTNHFDSKDSLRNEINKAIFTPLEIEEETYNSRPPSPKRPFSNPLKMVVLAPVNNRIRYMNLKHDYSRRTSFVRPHIISRGNYHVAVTIKPICRLSFI